MSKGAVVLEEPYKYLHMKSLDVDDGAYLTIGSLNQDHSSFYMNNEANVLFKAKNMEKSADSKEYKQFREIYNRLREECRVVKPEETYSIGGYIENKMWRFQLYLSQIVCMNREIKIPGQNNHDK